MRFLNEKNQKTGSHICMTFDWMFSNASTVLAFLGTKALAVVLCIMTRQAHILHYTRASLTGWMVDGCLTDRYRVPVC